MTFDLTFFLFGLIFTSICLHSFVSGIRNPPYSSRIFQLLMLAVPCLLAMALSVLSIFHKNNMDMRVPVIISISSLISTIVCLYVFIKGIRNPSYKNILFQCIIFILLGLYTMVLSVLKMFGVALWPN